MARRPRLVRGVGINDADYAVNKNIGGKRVMCPLYLAWMHMLERCYSASYQEKYPSYAGCKVAGDWHLFSTFKAWMELQDWQGKQLDKDVISPGNKVYSKDMCAFVSKAVNAAMNKCENRESQYPLGVWLDKSDGKFNASVRINGKANRVGRFDNPEDAKAAYNIAKSEYLIDLSCSQDNERVRDGLLKHAELYRSGAY